VGRERPRPNAGRRGRISPLPPEIFGIGGLGPLYKSIGFSNTMGCTFIPIPTTVLSRPHPQFW
jgi:hypothetical protein